MLSFKIFIATIFAGACVWGLVSWVSSSRVPAAMDGASASVIRGCESLDSDETRAVCPQLFCQQAVILTKKVPYKSRFAVTVDKEDGRRRLIGGDVSDQAPTDPTASFACVLEGARVIHVAVSDRASLEEIAAKPGGWSF